MVFVILVANINNIAIFFKFHVRIHINIVMYIRKLTNVVKNHLYRERRQFANLNGTLSPI